MWANLFAEISARPFVSTLIGLICLCSLALGLMLMHALVGQYAVTVLGWLSHSATVVWAAIFLLRVAVLAPLARRDAAEAESGWLSALPQMPKAMHRWSRWRTLALAMIQVLVLLLGIISVHRLAVGGSELPAFNWLAAVLVPMLAWIILPLLARSPIPRSAGRPARPRVSATATKREPRSILAHWQWTHYRSRRWTAGMRWSLGIVMLLVPAGAAFVQAGVTLLVGFLLLQLLQLWTSSLQVVVQASALTRALPLRSWPFVWEVSILPLLVAASLSLFAFATLGGMGLPLAAALVVAVVVFGASTLHAVTVLAWRHWPQLLGLRSALALLLWVLLSQVAPLTAPLIWTVLFFWFLTVSGKEAP